MYLYTFSRAFLHVFYILCIVNVCISKDSELTIDLPPGQKECFYEKVGQGSNIEIEYQVSIPIHYWDIWIDRSNMYQPTRSLMFVKSYGKVILDGFFNPIGFNNLLQA